MFKNYFKIAWRNLLKRKLYSAINIFGLSLGIACSFLLYLFISYNLSFDRYHKKASGTYRVLNELNFGKTLHEKGASIAMFRALSSGLANVSDAAVILSNYTHTVSVNDSPKAERRFKKDKSVALVSPHWFKMFDYKWIEGNAGQLNLSNIAIITQKQSEKYFGNFNPIGKIIVFENRQAVTIVGLVSDTPFNTDLKSDLFVSLSSLKNLSPGIFNDFFTDWSWMKSTTPLYITLNNIGFDRNAVVMVSLADSSASHRELLKEKLNKLPMASAFTFCFKPPSSDNDNGGPVKFDNRPDWETWPVLSAIGDNETVVNKLGLKSGEQAIGKSLIIGQSGDQKGVPKSDITKSEILNQRLCLKII